MVVVCAVDAAMVCDLPHSHSQSLFMCIFSSLFGENVWQLLDFRERLKSVQPTVFPFCNGKWRILGFCTDQDASSCLINSHRSTIPPDDTLCLINVLFEVHESTLQNFKDACTWKMTQKSTVQPSPHSEWHVARRTTVIHFWMDYFHLPESQVMHHYWNVAAVWYGTGMIDKRRCKIVLGEGPRSEMVLDGVDMTWACVCGGIHTRIRCCRSMGVPVFLIFAHVLPECSCVELCEL